MPSSAWTSCCVTSSSGISPTNRSCGPSSYWASTSSPSSPSTTSRYKRQRSRARSDSSLPRQRVLDELHDDAIQVRLVHQQHRFACWCLAAGETGGACPQVLGFGVQAAYPEANGVGSDAPLGEKRTVPAGGPFRLDQLQ